MATTGRFDDSRTDEDSAPRSAAAEDDFVKKRQDAGVILAH